MIKSMTAFGRAKCENAEKSVTVEIKSVNSRFFECKIKLPRAYSALEERIRNYIQENAIARARVEAFIAVENLRGSSVAVGIDEAYTESYLSALKLLSEKFGLRDDVSVMSVARNSEVFTSERPDADIESDWLLIKEALDEAIVGYDAMRSAEGKKAEADIKAKIQNRNTREGKTLLYKA